jgi:hypothetical protein
VLALAPGEVSVKKIIPLYAYVKRVFTLMTAVEGRRNI